jgi:hypothetical protein
LNRQQLWSIAKAPPIYIYDLVEVNHVGGRSCSLDAQSPLSLAINKSKIEIREVDGSR